MDEKELKKVGGILKMVDDFVLPLAEQGAKMTKNPMDDIVVSFLKGGVPSARKKIEELESQTPE
jgi:hypothetical protein